MRAMYRKALGNVRLYSSNYFLRAIRRNSEIKTRRIAFNGRSECGNKFKKLWTELNIL